jgi:hypothetical protein
VGVTTISRGIGGQFRITQRSALSKLYENSCRRCKQTISPAEQWYLTCQFKAFLDMQYFLKQFCSLSLIKLHIVHGVNNVQKCLFTAFSSLTTKLGTCHPNVCTAENGSQLLTATSYRCLFNFSVFIFPHNVSPRFGNCCIVFNKPTIISYFAQK